jgi:hypothetical protein
MELYQRLILNGELECGNCGGRFGGAVIRCLGPLIIADADTYCTGA